MLRVPETSSFPAERDLRWARFQCSGFSVQGSSASAKSVIPESAAGGYPESSESSTTSFGVWFPAFAGTLSGSRLSPAAGGLGRDDRLRNILWWEEIVVFPDGQELRSRAEDGSGAKGR